MDRNMLSTSPIDQQDSLLCQKPHIDVAGSISNMDNT